MSRARTLVVLALPPLSRHRFTRSPSHSRRTRLRLAIITAPDIYRHGIRARRLISVSRLSLAPPFLLFTPFSFRLFLPFFSFPFLFPSLEPSGPVFVRAFFSSFLLGSLPRVCMKLTGRTPHFALPEGRRGRRAVPPKFKLIAQLAAAGNSLGARGEIIRAEYSMRKAPRSRDGEI